MVASLSCEPLGFLIVSITFNKRFLFLGTVFFFFIIKNMGGCVPGSLSFGSFTLACFPVEL